MKCRFFQINSRENLDTLENLLKDNTNMLTIIEGKFVFGEVEDGVMVVIDYDESVAGIEASIVANLQALYGYDLGVMFQRNLSSSSAIEKERGVNIVTLEFQSNTTLEETTSILEKNEEIAGMTMPFFVYEEEKDKVMVFACPSRGMKAFEDPNSWFRSFDLHQPLLPKKGDFSHGMERFYC